MRKNVTSETNLFINRKTVKTQLLSHMQVQGKRDLTILRTFMRSERLRRNISQEQVAEYLNISQNSYSKLELGQTKLSIEQVMLMADIFEMRLIDLLNFKRLTFILSQREDIYKRAN